MAGLFGNLEPYSPDRPFIEWYERLEFYLEANQVEEDDQKRAILLSMIGATTFRTIKDLCFPTSPREKTFDEICKLLKDHYNPIPPKFVERKKFEERVRNQSESVQEFLVSLKKLSEFCQFGPNLNERLLDRFVMGVNHESVQKKLLQEDRLTIEKALSISQTMIESSKGAKSFETSSTTTPTSTGVHYTPTTKLPSKLPRINPCLTCGGQHKRDTCKFRTSKCFNCGKIGHLKKEEGELSVTNDESFYHDIYTISSNKKKALWVDLDLGKSTVQFQVDTGASTSVMSKQTFDRVIKEEVQLQPTNTKLSTFTGETLKVYGETDLKFKYNEVEYLLPLTIVDGTGPPLLGRDWLEHIKIDWHTLFYTSSLTIEGLLQKHANVFNEEAGMLNDRTIHLHMKHDARPIFKKARHPPYTLRNQIEVELQRLVKGGILEKTDTSEWATPIVPVQKSDKLIRLCGDFKTTINREIHRDEHPIPRIEELAAKLTGEQFSTIDFSHAYTQLCLDEDSQNLTTINTHCGLYKYKRLPFGISSCPAIWQRTIESIFSDIPNTVVYFDMFITGHDESTHLQTLDLVLSRCQEKGLTLKRRKCEFLKNEIDFLGHRVSKHGLLPQPEKIRAIKHAPKPNNVHELKAYLGMVNYYSQFIKNLSHELAPLYNLLKKDQKWIWGKEQAEAFNTSKELLSSNMLLVHYDLNKPIILTCDASPYGISAILSHKCEDKTERPVMFASRSLSKAEIKYSQLDKEALSIIFGVTKFHKYIYGRHVTIRTDHKPLLGLFGETKSVPEKSSSRIQRWAIILAAHDYDLPYVEGSRNVADGLSRLPLREKPESVPYPEDVRCIFHIINSTPVTSSKIAMETMKDATLQQVYNYTAHGWPDKVPTHLQTYFNRRSELSIDNDCVLWGTRIIIPESLRESMLEMLHKEHIGIVKMKMIARSYIWWPKIDSDLENVSKSCFQCQSLRNAPAPSPLHPWTWPEKPWSRIHIDFAGPFLGKMFLIIVDAHSKWMEVCVMSNITASNTIFHLRSVFSTHGLPDTIVSDNGPTFTSEEFKEFIQFNNIHHIRSAPFHPSSNGLAERGVKTFKTSLRKMSTGTIHEKVNRFLFKYRTTPHSTTGVTPAELMFNRKIKTRLDFIHDSVPKNVLKSQANQKLFHDKHAKAREFTVNDTVFVKNFTSKYPKNIPGTIVEQTGPVSFKVQSDQGIKRYHVDQMLSSNIDMHDSTIPKALEEEPEQNDNSIQSAPVCTPIAPISPPSIDINKPIVCNSGEGGEKLEQNCQATGQTYEPEIELRRSTRVRKKPDKLDL